MMKRLMMSLLVATVAASGCSSMRREYDRYRQRRSTEDPAPQQEWPDGLRWLHADVSAWPETAKLHDVRITTTTIEMPYDMASAWPGRDHVGAHVNANPWVIVQHRGRWYAATWEWLRVGQQSKARAALEPGHIKRRELDDWTPRSGDTLGFMVSGLARDHLRNAHERSNVVWVEWP
jgi:hypothetical protein